MTKCFWKDSLVPKINDADVSTLARRVEGSGEFWLAVVKFIMNESCEIG